MRNQIRTRSTMTRILVSILTWALVAGQVMQPVYAVTLLADVPIAAKVSAKPNIVYTLDDSGSMQFNYLPDAVANSGAVVNFTGLTRIGALASATGLPANSVGLGDWVTIAGVATPEWNGFYQVQSLIGTTGFKYTLTAIPVLTRSPRPTAS